MNAAVQRLAFTGDRMKRLLLIFGGAVLILGIPRISAACMCSYVDAQEAFLDAKLVFAGKVTTVAAGKEARVTYRFLTTSVSGRLEFLNEVLWEKSVEPVQIVTLEITDPFKGMAGETVDVTTAVYNGGGTCGVDFKVNETYLVYAYERRRELTAEPSNVPGARWTKEIKLKSQADKFNQRLPLLVTNVCVRTERMQWAGEDVGILHRIANGEINPQRTKRE